MGGTGGGTRCFESRPSEEKNWKKNTIQELNTRSRWRRSAADLTVWKRWCQLLGSQGVDVAVAEGLTQVAEGLGDHSIPREILEIPFRAGLRPPCPEDPAIGLLVGDKLGLDEALDVGAVGIGEALDGTGVFSIARADVVRSLVALLVGAVVAGTDTTAVEPLEMRLVT